MKKIAITLAAVAALGLAACTDNGAATNNATDLNVTETEAGNDVNASIDEANSISATSNALDSVTDTAGNVAADGANATADAANSVANSTN